MTDGPVSLDVVVNIRAKDGQVNVQDILRSLPKRVEQAFKAAPGFQATINPRVKVDPNLDVSALRREIQTALRDISRGGPLSAGLTPKQLEPTTKALKEHLATLRQLQRLQRGFDFSKDVLASTKAVLAGKRQVTDLNSEMAAGVRQFQQYTAQLQKLASQVPAAVAKTQTFAAGVYAQLARAQANLSGAAGLQGIAPAFTPPPPQPPVKPPVAIPAPPPPPPPPRPPVVTAPSVPQPPVVAAPAPTPIPPSRPSPQSFQKVVDDALNDAVKRKLTLSPGPHASLDQKVRALGEVDTAKLDPLVKTGKVPTNEAFRDFNNSFARIERDAREQTGFGAKLGEHFGGPDALKQLQNTQGRFEAIVKALRGINPDLADFYQKHGYNLVDSFRREITPRFADLPTTPATPATPVPKVDLTRPERRPAPQPTPVPKVDLTRPEGYKIPPPPRVDLTRPEGYKSQQPPSAQQKAREDRDFQNLRQAENDRADARARAAEEARERDRQASARENEERLRRQSSRDRVDVAERRAQLKREKLYQEDLLLKSLQQGPASRSISEARRAFTDAQDFRVSKGQFDKLLGGLAQRGLLTLTPADTQGITPAVRAGLADIGGNLYSRLSVGAPPPTPTPLPSDADKKKADRLELIRQAAEKKRAEAERRLAEAQRATTPKVDLTRPERAPRPQASPPPAPPPPPPPPVVAAPPPPPRARVDLTRPEGYKAQVVQPPAKVDLTRPERAPRPAPQPAASASPPPRGPVPPPAPPPPPRGPTPPGPTPPGPTPPGPTPPGPTPPLGSPPRGPTPPAPTNLNAALAGINERINTFRRDIGLLGRVATAVSQGKISADEGRRQVEQRLINRRGQIPGVGTAAPDLPLDLEQLRKTLQAQQADLATRKAQIQEEIRRRTLEDSNRRRADSEARRADNERRRADADARRQDADETRRGRDEDRARGENRRFDVDRELARRGQEVLANAGGLRGVGGIGAEDAPAARAALQENIEQLKRRREAAVGNREEFDRLTRAINEHEQGLRRLNDTLRRSNSLTSQTGALLRQFARYALAYGALYQVLSGISRVIRGVTELEDKLRQTQAITGATETQLSALDEAIKRTAITSRFKLGDIADAVKTIAQAGVSLKEIPGTVRAVANLATATGTQLQTAADVVTTIRSLYDELDVTTIADQVTRAVNVSKLSVEDLRTILNFGATFAKNANLSLQQYLGVVSTLRNAGVRGSTIGTGSGQLLLELFNPDKKTIDFLVKRYGELGEKLSGPEIVKRFAGFRYEDNPLFAALVELKRLGVDSAKVFAEFSRVLDKRAFNVLIPLLRDVDAVLDQTNQLGVGQTALSASAVAMNSLRASVTNLGDAIQVLVSELTSGAVPGLTKLVKSTTAAVEELIDANDRLKDRTGTGVGPSLLAGAYGFAIGASRPGSLPQRAATGAAGAIAGYSAARAGQEVTSAFSEDEALVQTTSTVAGIAGVGLLVKGVQALFNAFSGGGPGNPYAGAGGAGGVLTGIKNFLATIKAGFTSLAGNILRLGAAASGILAGTRPLTSVFSRIVLGLRALAGGSLVGRLITIGTTILGFLGLYEALDNDSDLERSADKIKDIESRIAREQAKQDKKTAAFEQFRIGTIDSPAAEGGTAANYAAAIDGVAKFRAEISQAIGVSVNDAYAAVKLVEDLRKRAPSQGPEREKLKSQLAKALGSSTGEVEEQAFERAETLAADIASKGRSFVDDLFKSYQRVLDLAATGGIEDDELGQAQLKAFQGLKENPIFRAILNRQRVTTEQANEVYQLYLQKLDEFGKEVRKAPDLAILKLQELTKAFQSNQNEFSYEKLKLQVVEAIHDLGESARGQVQQVIAGVRGVGDAARSAELEGVAAQGYDELLTRQTEALQKTKENADRALEYFNLPDFEKVLLSKGTPEEDIANAKGTVETLSRQLAGIQPPGTEALPEQREEFVDFLRSLAGVGAVALDANDIPTEDRVPAIFDTFNKLKDTYENATANIKDEEKEKTPPEFIKSVAYLEREREVRRLERDLERLKDTEPGVLGTDDPRNPIKRIAALKEQNLQEQLSYERAQPLDTQNRQLETIQNLEGDVEDVQAQARLDTENTARENKLRELRDQKGLIELQEEELKEQIETAIKAGSDTALLKAQVQLKELLEKRIDVEKQTLDADKRESATAKEIAEKRLERLRNERRREEAEERQKLVEEKFDTVEAQLKAFEATPFTGNAVLDSYLNAAGRPIPKALRIGRASAEEGLLTRSITESQGLIDSLRADYDRDLGKDPTLDLQKSNFIKEREAELYQLQERLGKVRFDLHQFKATFVSELGELSISGLADQIDDLDGSLQNLGENLNHAALSFIDNWTSAVASFVSNGFEIEGAAENIAGALERVREAELNLSQIELNRLDIEEKAAIALQNSNDPDAVRYARGQAREAQARSEELAREQLEAARAEQGQITDENSLFGQLQQIGQDYLKEQTFTLLKAGLLEGTKGLLGLFGQDLGEGLGERGSETNPMWVRVKGLGLPGEGGQARGGSGDVYSAFDSLVGGSGLSGFTPVGGVYNPAGQLQGAIDQGSIIPGAVENAGGFLVDTGLGGATKAAGGGGFFSSLFSGITSLFKNLFSGGGGFFSSLVSGIGSLFSGIGGLFGFNRGGYVAGPGTSTSDSIPARLSDGEYVVNAKATRAIGVQTLDRINDLGRRPLKLAMGGYVGEMVERLNSISRQPTTQQRGHFAMPEGGAKVTMIVHAKDAGSFLKSKNQIFTEMQAGLARSTRRNK